MPRVAGVEIGVVRLLLDPDGIEEADPLERLVPFQDAGLHRVAILLRNVAIEPVDDGPLRLGQRRARILLLEPPAVHQVDLREGCQVGAVVPFAGHEMTDAIVGDARMHRLGQAREAVHVLQEEAARIFQQAGRPRRMRARRRRLGRQARQGIVGQYIERRLVVARPHLGEGRVAAVEAIGQVVDVFQRRRSARQVVDQQCAGVDQHRLALAVRLARHQG